MTPRILKYRISDVAAIPQSCAITRRSALRRMLLVGSAVPLAALAGEKAFADTSQAQSKAVVYKIVTFQVPAESMLNFLAISTTNAAASRKEAGVIGFEVLIPADTPNTVIFIETYRNAAASASHMRSAHFIEFKEGAKQSGAKESAVIATRYMPK